MTAVVTHCGDMDEHGQHDYTGEQSGVLETCMGTHMGVKLYPQVRSAYTTVDMVNPFELPKEFGNREFTEGSSVIESFSVDPYAWTWTRTRVPNPERPGMSMLTWVSTSGDALSTTEFRNYLLSGGHIAHRNGFGSIPMNALQDRLSQAQRKISDTLALLAELREDARKIDTAEFRSYFAEEFEDMPLGTKVRLADTTTVWTKVEGILANEPDELWTNDRPPFVRNSSNEVVTWGQFTIVELGETSKPEPPKVDEEVLAERVSLMWGAYLRDAELSTKDVRNMLLLVEMMRSEQE